MNFRKSIGLLAATTALLALSAQPMFAMGGLRTAASPDSQPAAGKAFFGSKLDANAFPSNAYEGSDECPDPGACTLVMNRAYGNGKVAAPKAGYVDKIKVAAGVAGSFRLYFVKVKPGTQEAKAVKKGPVINFQGQPSDGDPMVIETFNIADIYVQAGWRIAIKTSHASVMRCDSGNGSFVYQPSLAVGNGYTDADDDSSCALLVQAIYR